MRILPSVTALCLGALLPGTTPSPGRASGLADLTEADKKARVPLDWMLLRSNTAMHNPGQKKEGAKEGQILRVTLYLDSKIDLKKINLPNDIDVIGKGADA